MATSLNPLELNDASSSIRGPKPVQQHSLKSLPDISVLGSSSPNSPARSPTKARRSGTSQLPVCETGHRQHDDVLPDSSRANDQKTPTQGSPQQPVASASGEKPHKYIQLLSIAYPPGSKSKLPTSSSGAEPAVPEASAGRQLGGAASRSSSSTAADVPPLLRSSTNPSLSSSLAAKSTTPLARAPRSRASILDSSPGPSLIPASPGATAPASPDRPAGNSRAVVSQSLTQASPSRKDWRTPGKTAGETAASPARRSLTAAVPRPQYAFGSRIDPNPQRKPSPMRQSAATLTAAGDRSRASPQRVPAAAKSSAALVAAAGPLRSASAPRMSSAEKVQSRFAQHQANAAAALRSKTPNPAARASASAAVGSSSATTSVAGSRVRPVSSSLTGAAERNIGRMSRTSDVVSRLPGTAAARSASPSTCKAMRGSVAGRSASPSTAMRGASRSMPAAAGGSYGSTSRVAAGNGGSPTTLKPVAPAGMRASGPRAERVSALAAGAAGSRPGSVSTVGIPTLGDRYKSSYGRHTPAALAVAEANAAGTAAGTAAGSSTGLAVPKLALGALLGKSPSGPALVRSREREGSSNTPQPQQQQPGRAASLRGSTTDTADHHDAAASPFLGRMSAIATPPAASAAHMLHVGLHTPPQRQQQRSLLPLDSTSGSGAVPGTLILPTPVGGVGRADADCTPLAGEHSRGTDLDLMQHGPLRQELGARLSPPLLPRELSGASMAAESGFSREASRELSREGSRQLDNASVAGLSKEGSAVSIDSASVAVAAKGLMLPLHRLEEQAAGQFSSPPKHRRGEQGSPKGAASSVCSQLLKNKVSSVCSSSSSGSKAHAAASAEAAAAGADARGESAAAAHRPAGGGAAAVAAKRRGMSAAAAVAGDRAVDRDQVVGSGADQVTPKGPAVVAGLQATPGTSLGSQAKAMSCSPGDKQRALVPRLDLTPLLTHMDEDQAEEDLAEAHQQQPGQLLLLEHEPRRLNLDEEEEEQLHRSRARPGVHEGKPESTGKRGASAGGSGRRAAGGSSKGSAAAEAAPQESFYVYESVMPQEETRTYEDLRRALLKCPGGHRLASSLQGIWGCYQDARRNTEAMAFRGHRLLDQVSNEYCTYKREAEQQLQLLQQERDVYKEDLQLALTTGSVKGSELELAQKDKQVRELQHEVQELRLQMEEMHKALHKAADYHYSQQADQVPVKARTIAESATTSILFQQNIAQQEELIKSQKMLEDMKAALLIACGALKQTNFMEPDGHVRAGLQADTVAVLDMMVASTDAEASMLDQVHAAAAAAVGAAVQPHVHIEEVHEDAI